MWPGCSWNSSLTRAVARFITWAAEGRTASRFWKPSTCWRPWDSTLQYDYNPTNRIGDHICYISDLSKIRAHFPNWKLEYDLPKIVSEIVDRQLHLLKGQPAAARTT